MATTSSMVSVSQEGWTEVESASGANRIVTIELLRGKNMRFASDDAVANIPAGYTGQEFVTLANPVATVLVENGEKLFAKCPYPNALLSVWGRDET